MSSEIIAALAVVALAVIIVVASGFGLDLVRKEKLVRDSAVLLAVTGIVICGIYFLHR